MLGDLALLSEGFVGGLFGGDDFAELAMSYDQRTWHTPIRSPPPHGALSMPLPAPRLLARSTSALGPTSAVGTQAVGTRVLIRQRAFQDANGSR